MPSATRCTRIGGAFAAIEGNACCAHAASCSNVQIAHLYDTGGMRRVHLRGHTNILKRLLIHTAGFNLGLLMRQLIGVGTPRGLQGRILAMFGTILTVIRARWQTVTRHWPSLRHVSTHERVSIARYDRAHVDGMKVAFTTG